MSKIFVGTSGWLYDWNQGKTLDWYLQYCGLPAIELNMSYYRFPYPNMVKTWAKKASNLAWVIKVHRLITHYKMLSADTYTMFQRFQQVFQPLENSIHYYLLQLPPKFTDLDVLERFVQNISCDKLAVEVRNPVLFNNEVVTWGKKMNVLLVSVDAPHLPSMMMSDQVVYERVHGKTIWYEHDYSHEELLEIKKRIQHVHPKVVYVFFNNNHAMLANAQMMYQTLQQE